MQDIDSIPSNVQSASREALLYVFEDNEAVIKMIMKGRSPTMRHVSRTHRVALDWLFDRINLDPKIQIKYIDTKNQLADILTKGNFTREEWNHLLSLFNISHFSSTVCSAAMAKRIQQESGEERVTAKSRPVMNLIARTPSVVSSSTSVSPGKKYKTEVEMVDSVDDLMSSPSIRGISMPNFEVLDARIASALNKIIHNSQFKRRISLEEQKAQKEDRFFRGRQIAYLIYDHFWVTGIHDSVENYADLFTISLRNDDIQEFDSKWDGILLSMTKIPPDEILEGLCKLRIRASEKLKTVLELYDLETHQKKLGPDYHRLKAMVKRSIEQEIRNKNFGARSGNFEKNAVVKNQGTKQRVQRILGDCWQWETNGQCVKGNNCSFRHDMDKRGKSSPSNPSQNSFMQQSERKPSRTRSPRGKSPSGRMSRWPCKDYLRGTCNNSFCKRWHPPECLFYKTKSGCRFGEKCSHAHRQVDAQSTKWSKSNNDKSAVALLKKGDWHERESVSHTCHDRTGKPGKRGDKKLGQNSSKRQFSDARQLGCIFQDMTPPKSILRKSTDMPKPIQRVKFTKAVARHTKIRDQNPSLGYICPGEPHERSPNAPKFEDRSQEETEWQELGAREAAWKLAKNVFKLKEHERAAFFSSPENRCLPASTLKPEEREFVVDSGASMHMIRKKDLNSAEMDTLRKLCSPTIVITANGEVQTHEEATVYVKEMDIFLTMKVLENTPAVLSLGKLCDENGYSYEWINCQKPHLI